MKIAVFPGTFDPITLGHIDIIERGLQIFDKIYIAVGVNPKKSTFFPLEKRIEWLNSLFENNHQIIVESYTGLTVDFCKAVNANFVLRGLRSFEDFEYEKRIAYVNKELMPNLESVFLFSAVNYGNVSSSLVREVLSCGGNINGFVPKKVVEEIAKLSKAENQQSL